MRTRRVFLFVVERLMRECNGSPLDHDGERHSSPRFGRLLSCALVDVWAVHVAQAAIRGPDPPASSAAKLVHGSAFVLGWTGGRQQAKRGFDASTSSGRRRAQRAGAPCAWQARARTAVRPRGRLGSEAGHHRAAGPSQPVDACGIHSPPPFPLRPLAYPLFPGPSRWPCAALRVRAPLSGLRPPAATAPTLQAAL